MSHLEDVARGYVCAGEIQADASESKAHAMRAAREATNDVAAQRKQLLAAVKAEGQGLHFVLLGATCVVLRVRGNGSALVVAEGPVKTHGAYMRSQWDVDFEALRAANRRRQEEWGGNGKADVPFRALELVGELGELCEALKKLERAQRGIEGTHGTLEEVADEAGDVLVSLDLLLDALGINAANAVRRKFNLTSEKYGKRTRLGEPDKPLPSTPSSTIDGGSDED